MHHSDPEQVLQRSVGPLQVLYVFFSEQLWQKGPIAEAAFDVYCGHDCCEVVDAFGEQSLVGNAPFPVQEAVELGQLGGSLLDGASQRAAGKGCAENTASNLHPEHSPSILARIRVAIGRGGLAP